MKKVVIALSVLALLSSCVSKKKYAELEAKNKETQDLLNTCSIKLNTCLEEKAAISATAYALRDQNLNLMETSKEMAILSTKGAQNIEKALESIKEKDLKISRMQDALTKKDSVTLAVVTSLKSAVGLSDPDIEINVEKGVVFISIADKLLFKSGSYEVTDKAKNVLAKVAKVINDKPDFECMVEGHTDNVPFTGSGILIDNWDLSVLRATSVVRYLTELQAISPERLTATGKGQYQPVELGNSTESRSKNRRIEIVLSPKLDELYNLIK